jgi:putative hydrolase of the HAD superfamily
LLPFSDLTEPIRAVLFDYGLVLTGPPDPAAWSRMQQITGLSEPAFSDAYWAPRHDYDRGHHTGREYWQAVGQHAELTLKPSQIDALIGEDTALWTRPNQPMVDWAQRLQAAGTPTGILSNLGDEMMHGVLATFPWINRFQHRVWSHTLKLAKPDPQIYAASARGLHLPAASILFVDDREDNIAGALAAGMQAIRYPDQQSFLREMQARGLGEVWDTGRLPS